jgi:hypothetical protein
VELFTIGTWIFPPSRPCIPPPAHLHPIHPPSHVDPEWKWALGARACHHAATPPPSFNIPRHYLLTHSQATVTAPSPSDPTLVASSTCCRRPPMTIVGALVHRGGEPPILLEMLNANNGRMVESRWHGGLETIHIRSPTPDCGYIGHEGCKLINPFFNHSNLKSLIHWPSLHFNINLLSFPAFVRTHTHNVQADTKLES